MSRSRGGGSPEAAIQRAVFPQVRDNIKKALRRARCAVHGQTPTRVEVSGRDLKSLQWMVYGCCQEGLTEAARRAIAEQRQFCRRNWTGDLRWTTWWHAAHGEQCDP
jgi:hypothetical protein